MLAPVQITDVFSARIVVADVQQRAQLQGVGLRQAPPEPTTCCGRGCNGCVWEGYFGAVQFWLEDAQGAFDQVDNAIGAARVQTEGCARAV